MQLKCKKNICVVHGEGAVADQTCQKWFATFLGITDIVAQSPLLRGRPVHWRTFSSTPGLSPLEAHSGRQWTYSKYPNQ